MKLSEVETAARLGIRRKTLANWRSSGGGPVYYKLGARVVYDEADLDAWVESRRRKSTFEAAGSDLAIGARP